MKKLHSSFNSLAFMDVRRLKIQTWPHQLQQHTEEIVSFSPLRILGI